MISPMKKSRFVWNPVQADFIGVWPVRKDDDVIAFKPDVGVGQERKDVLFWFRHVFSRMMNIIKPTSKL